VQDHNVVGYGKAIVLHKCPMVSLLISVLNCNLISNIEEH
jgi:hypothetical protein